MKEGIAAPEFEKLDHNGETVTLSNYKGKRLVVYFYPKDDTPGCTVEACNFRSLYSEIKKRGAELVGVSADTPATHEQFRAKYSLPFSLLADIDHTMCKEWGAWGIKERNGKKYEGILRNTYVIDAEGRVEHIFKDVDPHTHPQKILEYLSA